MRCIGCQLMSINGLVCHEIGCPEGWRGEERQCKWCGQTFEAEGCGWSYHVVTAVEPDRCCACEQLWDGITTAKGECRHCGEPCETWQTLCPECDECDDICCHCGQLIEED